jgi:hypothetical protein
VVPGRSLSVLIEKAIKESDLPPTKTELRRTLPPNTTTVALEEALNLLVGSGKVLIDRHGRTVWVAVDNERLRKLVDSAVRVR